MIHLKPNVRLRLTGATAAIAILAFAPINGHANQIGATAPLEDREITGFSQVLRRNRGPDVTQSAPEQPVAPAPEVEQEDAEELLPSRLPRLLTRLRDRHVTDSARKVSICPDTLRLGRNAMRKRPEEASDADDHKRNSWLGLTHFRLC